MTRYETYKIIRIDTGTDFKVKLPYLVLKYASADVRQVPTYRLVKQERTEQRAQAYVTAHTQSATPGGNTPF